MSRSSSCVVADDTIDVCGANVRLRVVVAGAHVAVERFQRDAMGQDCWTTANAGEQLAALQRCATRLGEVKA